MLYRYSPLLITYVPKETIELWLRFRNLNPRLLLPSMINYENNSNINTNYSLKYLETIINDGNTDQVIHNYLFHLYVKQGVVGIPPILTLLKLQVSLHDLF